MAINSAPGLQYDSEGGVTGFRYDNESESGTTGNAKLYSNTPGNVGYYERVQSNSENGGWEYIWNPSPYDYESAAFNNPDLSYLSSNPEEYQALYDLKTSNPIEYTAKLAEGISNSLFNNYTRNKGTGGQLAALEAIKDVNPQAYYNAQLKYLGQQMGWQIGQNTSERNAPTQAKLQELVPQAIEAGISPEQINSLVGTSLNTANAQNQNRIANEAANGGGGFNFAKDLLPGLLFVGGSAAGMYGIDSLIGAAAAASAAGGAGGLTASSIPTLATGLEVGAGSALAGTGAGAAAIPSGGALASLGSLGYVAPTIGGSAGFLAPTLGANVASSGIGLTAAQVPSLIGGLEVGSGSVLSGSPFKSGAFTDANLGYTGAAEELGLEGSSTGLTDLSGAQGSAMLDSMGLNTSLFPNLNLGQVLGGAQLAKGLLGAGQNPLQAQPAGIPAGGIGGQRQGAGVDYSPILNLLSIQSPQRKTSLLG